MFTFAEGQRAAEEDDARSEMSLFSEVCILSSKASHASLSSGTDDFVLL